MYVFFISFNIKVEVNYIVEVYGTIKEVNTHKYTETDNFKFLAIDGIFKDNLGNFGSDQRLTYSIIGEEINRAQRLKDNSDLNGILISYEIYVLIQDLIDVEKRENYV